MNYTTRIQIAQATTDWAKSLAQRSTHFVTLNPHRPARFDRGGVNTRGSDAHALLRRWDAYVNCDLIGKRWQEAGMRHLRCEWVAYPEGHELNRHWHLLWRLSADLYPERVDRAIHVHLIRSTTYERQLEHLLNWHWKRVIPSGTCVIREVSSPDGLAFYATKEQIFTDNQASFITSKEFHTS